MTHTEGQLPHSRCGATGPDSGMRCELTAGHSGNHVGQYTEWEQLPERTCDVCGKTWAEPPGPPEPGVPGTPWTLDTCQTCRWAGRYPKPPCGREGESPHRGFEKGDPLSDPYSGQGPNAQPGLSQHRSHEDEGSIT